MPRWLIGAGRADFFAEDFGAAGDGERDDLRLGFAADLRLGAGEGERDFFATGGLFRGVRRVDVAPIASSSGRGSNRWRLILRQRRVALVEV